MVPSCLKVSRSTVILPPLAPWVTNQSRSLSLNTAINGALRSEKRKRPLSHPGSGIRQTTEKVPDAIKPSRSDSELISGQHSIIAALKLQRRKLIKLYYDKSLSEVSKVRKNMDIILKLARGARVEAVSLPRADFLRHAAASGRTNNVSLQ
jgi:hypothetical protein